MLTNNYPKVIIRDTRGKGLGQLSLIRFRKIW